IQDTGGFFSGLTALRVWSRPNMGQSAAEAVTEQTTRTAATMSVGCKENCGGGGLVVFMIRMLEELGCWFCNALDAQRPVWLVQSCSSNPRANAVSVNRFDTEPAILLPASNSRRVSGPPHRD